MLSCSFLFYFPTGKDLPVTAYDKNQLKVVIHVGKERPRPDVVVMVISTMSSNTNPVKKFQFQAAVPKVCDLAILVFNWTSRTVEKKNIFDGLVAVCFY